MIEARYTSPNFRETNFFPLPLGTAPEVGLQGIALPFAPTGTSSARLARPAAAVERLLLTE
jgi:hypothetical protein